MTQLSSQLPRVTVVQDGARLHYAIPIALKRAGLLHRTYTEWFARPGSLEAALAHLVKILNPSAGRRMLERYSPELVSTPLSVNLPLVIRHAFARRRFPTSEEFYQWASASVGGWIQSEGLQQANTLFGFVRNVDPDLCAWARQKGAKTVGDQMIAPAAIERREASLQSQRWGGWNNHSDSSLSLVERIERQTWDNLDHLTCASEYVRNGLVEQGLSPDKISVLPYPFNLDNNPLPTPAPPTRQTLRVGFVGAVSLRKGAPYFLEVARRLRSVAVRFEMVGPIHVSPLAVDQLSPHVHLAGPVPRSQIAHQLQQFDLLLFPSTCEGSASAVMEAMASGLPVVTTPNSGSVVRHGIEGFVHPYDDLENLTQSVARLLSDPDLRRQMGAAARTRVEEFSINWYSKALSDVLRRLLNQPQLPSPFALTT